MKVTRQNLVWEKHQKQVPTVDDEGDKLWGCFRSCFLQSAAPYTEAKCARVGCFVLERLASLDDLLNLILQSGR